jgi:hemerythrin-like domain-containing protein
MQPKAVQLILDDHRDLAEAMHALCDAVDAARQSGQQPAFKAMRAMLFYLDEMPARLHHAIESQLLFPRIRERCPALQPVLDRLEAEHARGETAVRDLERALVAWERFGESRRPAFELQLRAYADAYLGHMEVEENYVLPVALDYLLVDDWHELETAFGHQRNAFDKTRAPGRRDV